MGSCTDPIGMTLVQRLRAEAATFGVPTTDSALHIEAADEIERLVVRVEQLQSELEREHADHQETLRDSDAVVAAERERWRPAAEKARAALSELLTSRDPIVYSEALAALDAVLTPNVRANRATPARSNDEQ